jgi:hypothetical protein
MEEQMTTATIEQDQVTPKAKRPRKATGKPNGERKAAKGAKLAPKAAKAAVKAPKGKAAVDQFGYRVGSIKSQAAAMYASKRGATLAEVKAKLNSVQLNLLTDVATKGFKVSKVKEDGPGPRQVTRYFLRSK